MKNLKRFLAVVVVVAIMAVSMIPAFAAGSSSSSAVSVVTDLGVLKGGSNGVDEAYLGTSTERIQAAILTLRLLGVEEEARAYSDWAEGNFQDAEKNYKGQTEVLNLMAYLKANPQYGWQGDGKIFNPKEIATPQMIYKVMLTALGYTVSNTGDVSYANVVGFASALGMNKIAGLKTVTNNDFATALVEALNANMKGENGYTLACNLVDNSIIDATTAADLGLVVIVDSLTTDKATVAVNNGVSAADLKKALDAVKVSVKYTDGTTETVKAEDVIWDTTAVKAAVAGTYKVTASIKDVDAKATVNVVVGAAALDFTLSADNYKQVTVKFNNPVDATAGADKANYSVNDVAASAVSLSSDKTTAVVTLATAIAQQGDMKVKILKAVGFANDTTKTLSNVVDATLPAAQSIAQTGPKTFAITFSEPLKTVGTVLVNNGAYGVLAPSISGNVLNVTFNADVANGDYAVKVSNATDFADYKMISKDFTLTMAKDTTAPTVSVKSAEQNKVVVVFNKDVTGVSALSFYHTFSAWNPDSVTPISAKEYQLNFDKFTIPEGSYTLTVLVNDGTNDIKDLWGNKLAADTKLTVTVAADKVAPTVTKIEATTESTVKVTFSESVENATVEADYTVKAPDGSVIDASKYSVAYDATNKVATFTFDPALAGGTYTIEFPNTDSNKIRDTSLSKNNLVQSALTFAVTDKTPATVSKATYVQTAAGTAEYIYVTFSENMATSGAGSVLDVANYRLNGAALPDGTTIVTFGSAAKVKITLPDGTDVTKALTYGQLADAAGNKMVALSGSVTPGTETTPSITEVKTISANTIQITIGGLLSTVVADGFTVNGSVYNLASVSYTLDTTNNKTIVTGTLRSECALATSDAKPTEVDVVAGKIITDTGLALGASSATGATIVDGIAPTFVAPNTDALKEIAAGTDSTKNLVFSEKVKAINPALAATDLVVTYDGSVLVAGVDYEVAISSADNTASTTIVVTIHKTTAAGKTLTIATASSVKYIKDLSGNAIKAFSQTYSVK